MQALAALKRVMKIQKLLVWRHFLTQYNIHESKQKKIKADDLLNKTYPTIPT